ncbi:MAG TPA: DUF488 domain-containing protein [Solirubrobacteraceae bacterium]|nr:DUF488 domain-containing protein [Solirubrobacteraceae bacterium]
MPRIATIGVYGFDGERFIEALDQAGVTLVVDVRQRRGVRGSQYAWANAGRLTQRLADSQIRYLHHPELAPTTEMRELQYAADDRAGVGKRSRETLAPEYVSAYTAEVLDVVGVDDLLADLPVHGRAALLCVEAAATACHRSLIAARLADAHGFEVEHLGAQDWTPPTPQPPPIF